MHEHKVLPVPSPVGRPDEDQPAACVENLVQAAPGDDGLEQFPGNVVGGAFNFSRDQDVPNGGLGDLYGAIDGFLFGPNTYDARPDSNGIYSHDGAYANPAEVIAEGRIDEVAAVARAYVQRS